MRKPELPENEAQRLAMLRTLGLLDSPREERFDRLSRLVAHCLGTSMALITLVDERRQWFKSAYGLEIKQTPRDISFCGHAILNPTMLMVVPDAREDERFQDNPLVTGAPYIRFYAGMPISLADGTVIGTLCVLDQQPHVLSEQQRRDLQDFAAVVETEVRREVAENRSATLLLAQKQAEALVAASPLAIVGCDAGGQVMVWNEAAAFMLGVRAQESLERPLADSAPELSEFLTAMQQRPRSEAVVQGEPLELPGRHGGVSRHLRVSISRVRDVSGGDGGWLMVLADVTHERQLTEALEQEHELLTTVLENVAVAVVACDNNGRLTLFNNQAAEWLGPEWELPEEQWQQHYKVRDAWDGRLLNVRELPLYRALHGERVLDQEVAVTCRDQDERILSCNGRALVTASGQRMGAVVVLHDVTRRKQHEQALAHEAAHDLLTGLPNRGALLDHLEKAIARCVRHNDSLGVLFVDLNRFKQINDTMGHEVGDQVLREFAQRLEHAVRRNDTVGRLAGDEFVVIAEDLHDPVTDLRRIGEQLLDAVNTKVETSLGYVPLEVSIGAALYQPKDTPGTLLTRADQAMYRAKRGETGFLCIDGGSALHD